MNLQQVLSLTRKCIDKYNLIVDGDVIAVSAEGITGTPAANTAVTYNATTKKYEV